MGKSLPEATAKVWRMSLAANSPLSMLFVVHRCAFFALYCLSWFSMNFPSQESRLLKRRFAKKLDST